MDFSKLSAAAGREVTEDNILTVFTELATAANQVPELSSKMEQLRAEAADRDASDAVAAAEAVGKIPDGERDAWVAMARDDRERFDEFMSLRKEQAPAPKEPKPAHQVPPQGRETAPADGGDQVTELPEGVKLSAGLASNLSADDAVKLRASLARVNGSTGNANTAANVRGSAV